MTVSRLLRVIYGNTSGRNDAYKFCANKEQLSEALRAFRSEVLRRLFIGELGMSSLSAKFRTFMEIESYPGCTKRLTFTSCTTKRTVFRLQNHAGHSAADSGQEHVK